MLLQLLPLIYCSLHFLYKKPGTKIGSSVKPFEPPLETWACWFKWINMDFPITNFLLSVQVMTHVLCQSVGGCFKTFPQLRFTHRHVAGRWDMCSIHVLKRHPCLMMVLPKWYTCIGRLHSRNTCYNRDTTQEVLALCIEGALSQQWLTYPRESYLTSPLSHLIADGKVFWFLQFPAIFSHLHLPQIQNSSPDPNEIVHKFKAKGIFTCDFPCCSGNGPKIFIATICMG